MSANEIKISKYEYECINCGAILNKGVILCPYCKTSYPSDERVVVTGSQKEPRIGVEANEITKSYSKNIIFFGILITRIIIGLFIFSEIQFPYSRAILSCVFLTLIPGLLIMLMLKIRKIGVWEYLIFTIGLSIAFLMFGGLFVNLALPLVGIDEPLSLIPLFISFDILLLIFWIIAYTRNKEISIEIKLPKMDLSDKILFIVPVAFPLLSILGATTLNNGGPNYLTMILFGGIVVYFFSLALLRKKLNKNIYPWGILMMSISLLLSNSLRSWHLTGGDISLEYYVFQLTKYASHWGLLQFNDPYNACLSITILPTILSNFLNISDEYILKVIFPIIFSFSVISLYLVLKKYLKDVLSFISILFFIIQLPFLIWITGIARQEIALFFFSLFLLAMFSSNFKLKTKEILFIIFGFSIVVSHYSTIYITLFLLSSSFITNHFIRKSILKWNKHRYRDSEEMLASQKANKKYFVPGRLILILLLFTFMWYSVFTQTSVSLSQVVKNNINNLQEEYKSSSIRGIFSLNPFSTIFTTTDQDVIDYSDYTQAAYSDMDELNLYDTDKYKDYTIFPVPSRINPIPNIFVYNTMLIAQKIITSIFKLSFLLGGIFLLIISFRRKLFDIEYLSLVIGSVIILFIIILVPYISLEYNFERLYLQTLYILAFPALLGMRQLLILFTKFKTDIIIILLLISFYLLYNTGFTTQIVGGEPTEILNNYGVIYAQNYTHDSEIKSIEWLSRNRDKISLIYVDKASERKLMAYGNIVEGLKRDILPSAIDERAYIYLSQSNVADKVILQLFKGKIITYNLPENFLSNNTNVIYDNQYTKIYK
ncbi:MAG: DUF2206 domain-containing protein [Actinomycetia bacterium]|nr:DUF2206 domain-containing protein [Actinomycetes bacterium]